MLLSITVRIHGGKKPNPKTRRRALLYTYRPQEKETGFPPRLKFVFLASPTILRDIFFASNLAFDTFS